MFCYQCEQTATGAGCQTLGVCGKDETTATLHDLLIHVVKGVSVYDRCVRGPGAVRDDVEY
jgi:hydroxylamine reductase